MQIHFPFQESPEIRPVQRHNGIATNKYNLVTFLPFALLIQFMRFSNIYFLIIAGFSFWGCVSSISPLSSILPLIFVIILSMIREALEDYDRFKQDKIANCQRVSVYKNGYFTECESKLIKIGDIIKIVDKEIICADAILIKSSRENGEAFVETSQLDGEKNLKQKLTVSQVDSEPIDWKGSISCELPSTNLHSFQGKFIMEDVECDLGIKNLLMKGTKLTNTEYAIGIVVYTGKETKIMMQNQGASPNKISKTEQISNKLVVALFFLQIILSLIPSILNYAECKNGTPSSMKQFNDDTCASEDQCFLQAFYVLISYLLLTNTLIPISLTVSLEIVKFVQGKLIERDRDLPGIKVQTCSINEDLGQIEYVLTDKTGTLTKNEMMFKCGTFGNQFYGTKDCLVEQNNTFFENYQRKKTSYYKNNPVNSCFISQSQKYIMLDKDETRNLVIDGYDMPSQFDIQHEVLMLMVTCHQCILFNNEFNGPSPDEIELLNMAREFGYCYQFTKHGIIHVKINLEQEEMEKEFQLLQLFEFDSDRKRMSVIVKANGIIKLYMKGADSIVEGRLKLNNQPFLYKAKEMVNAMSRKGFRTLFQAMRIITEEEYQEFEQRMIDQKENKSELINAIEQNLTLIGCTGVEDKLQDDVSETIKDLIKAHIKVWMLTGDKFETALDIAKSCGLISDDSIVFKIQNIESLPEIEYQIKENLRSAASSRVAVIEGTIISNLSDQQLYLLRFMNSVVCCRVTPKQKAEMVELVKTKFQGYTLAIGDGANDVNMIEAAHVGLGIMGKEGMRASQASDYSISEFRSIWKLVLYYGRQNYMRNSQMILYFYYKNIVFTIPQLLFSFYCGYSAQSIFDSFYMTLFNCAFTFFPVVIRAIFDEDLYYTQDTVDTLTGHNHKNVTKIEEDILFQYYPILYYVGQLNTMFNKKEIAKWMLTGLVQGIVCFLIIFTFSNNSFGILNQHGYSADIWVGGITLYSAIIILVTIKLAMNTQFYNIITWAAYIVTSFFLYFFYIYIAGLLKFMPNTYGTGEIIYTSLNLWFNVIIAALGMFCFDAMIFSFKQNKKNLLNYLKKQVRLDNNLDETKIIEYEKLLNEKINKSRKTQVLLRQRLESDQPLLKDYKIN